MSTRQVFRIVLVSLLLLLIPIALQAAEWSKTYGGNGYEYANAIQQTSDGGYVMAGSTESFGAGQADVWVVKLDGDGEIQWQKAYGGSAYDLAYSVRQTTDGGYIVGGTTSSFGATSYDAWIIKLDANGSVVWQKVYGGSNTDNIEDIRQTSDGGYICLATTNFNTWLLKLDPNGFITWQKTYGSNRDVSANSIQQTFDGGYIIAVGSQILKLDANGIIHWQKTYHDPIGIVNESVNAAIQISGGYIVSGYREQVNVDSPPIIKAFLLRLDTNGNIQWQKVYGKSGQDYPRSLEQTSDGGYVMAGFAEYYNRKADAWVVKLNGDGKIQWQKTYNNSLVDASVYIFQSTDGGYIIVDSTDLGAGRYDARVAKIDSAANIPDCQVFGELSFVAEDLKFNVSDSSTSVQDTNITAQTSNASETDTTVTPGGICISGTMEMPNTVNIFTYSPIVTPSLDTNPSSAKPIGVGTVAAGGYSVSLQVGLLSFTAPVDIYLAIYAPAVSPEIWVINSNKALQPLSSGFAKWKENTKGPVSESLFGDIGVSSLPKGTYTLYIGVTPVSNLNAYYLWTTDFNVL